MRAIVNALLAVAALVGALFLGEGLFAWLGLPGEPALRAAHPPEHSEMRESIEFRYHFATNSRGLRYREIPLERPPATHRVLVLGDSYTEGLGVEMHERFTERLERDLSSADRAVEFVNGGLSGTGPRYYARLLKHVGLDYAPDTVMVCVFANDVANTHEDPARDPIDPPRRSSTGVKGLASRWWPRIYTQLAHAKERWQHRQRSRTSDYVATVAARARAMGIDETRIAAWAQSLPPSIVDAINADRFGFGVLAYGLLYPEFWTDSLDLDSARSEAKWRNMVVALDAIETLARGSASALAMVYLPVHFQYDPASHEPDNLALRTGTLVRRAWLEGESALEARLRRWASRRRIPFLSLTSAFRAAVGGGERLDFPLDGHWTPAGHAVAARAIGRWLRTQSVLDGTAAPRR